MVLLLIVGILAMSFGAYFFIMFDYSGLGVLYSGDPVAMHEDPPWSWFGMALPFYGLFAVGAILAYRKWRTEPRQKAAA